MTDSIESLIAPLNDLCVIEIAGADAASFLHGQLTHDITELKPGSARLAGYCTAKGRLLGSLVVWQGLAADTPTLYALAKADVAQALIKRLSMFVLRAKAKLRLTDMRVYGVTLPHSQTPEAMQALAQAGLTPPQALPVSATAYTALQSPTATWVAAPSANAQTSRWWLVQAPDSSQALAATADGAFWQAADIAAGLPWVVEATQDTFIPQTLNLDLIDGVSFTKGCYPGQEVVARSHYRGTVKRRMAYGIAAAAEQPARLAGVDIYNADQPDSPCGRVINAATTGGQTHLLLEVQLADLHSADFRLAAADGEKISIQALPYAIVA